MDFFNSSSSSSVTQLAKDNAQFIAIAGGIVAAFIAYNLTNRNRTGAKRAPLVRYTIPWLGSAMELGKDPDGLFKKATATLGPVFRVCAAGREFTYITAPELISAVYRDSKTFTKWPITAEMTEKIFGASHTMSLDPVYLEDYFKAHHQQLSAASVVTILQRYGAFTYEALQSTLDKLKDDNTTGLSFIKAPAYDAAAYAFFGKTFPSKESYEPFNVFDGGFLLLQTKLPHFLLKKPIQAREKLIKMFEKYLSKPHDERAALIDVNLEIASRTNWSLRDQAVALLGDLWGLETNAIQAIYWILALQLQRPEGLTNLIEEIDTARNNWLKNNPTTKDETHCQWIVDGSFPLLTSTIQESLRYTTMSFSIRLVDKETVLGGHYVPKGDYVICNTRLIHLDEDIHQDSTEFIPDRYMKNTKFTKGGRTVPNHTIPFGGGTSICHGRHFAQGELKIFIALFLTLATIEIDPSSSERPRFNYSQMGIGIIPPIGDLPVRVTKRVSSA